MEYIVLKAGTLDALVKSVNREIKNGYKPIGNVSCMVDYYRIETYIQAMVKGD